MAFWRWAIWKVFENHTDGNTDSERPGLVSFITASSYLRGPAFAGMREDMRRTFDHLWILDLGGDSRGAVKTENVFAIQTPVCIAIGIRSGAATGTPAQVKYHRAEGTREAKLAFLSGLNSMKDIPWQDCPDDWQAPLMPRGTGDYWAWPEVTKIFPVQFSGAQYKRTWPIGETRDVLVKRWEAFKAAPRKQQGALFRETAARLVVGEYGDLNGKKMPSLASETNVPRIQRYGFRSFDRMWAFHDPRFADRIRPDLQRAHGPKQVYMVSFLTEQMSEGPAATASSHVPDLHAFRGSFGGQHVIPLYLDAAATVPNLYPGLLAVLEACYGFPVQAEQVFAYAYALLATPAYETHFREDLTIPGPRLPITRDGALFTEVATAGQALLHLHTYGERFGTGSVPEGTAGIARDIPGDAANYPAEFRYVATTRTLHVGAGEVTGVSEAVWNFGVSGLKVLQSWLAYRMKEGAGRQSGELAKIRPERWTPELTEELLELLWLLEGTLASYPELTALLERVLAGEALTLAELPEIEAENAPARMEDDGQPGLFG